MNHQHDILTEMLGNRTPDFSGDCAMTPNEKQRCAVCARAGKACSGCKNIYYCSKECQKLDWPMHRTLCASFKDFERRPAPNMRRAIHFPVNGSKPEFVWLPLDATGHPDIKAINKTWFDDLKDGTWPVYVDDTPSLNLHSQSEIMLTCHKYFAREKFPLNECIFNLSGKTTTFWKGPVIAYAYFENLDDDEDDSNDDEEEEEEDTEVKWVDLDTTNLKIIMDWVMVRSEEGKTNSGVRINSDGSIDANKLPDRFEPMSLESSRSLSLGKIGHDSKMARCFGMPLTVIAPPLEDEIDASKPGGEEMRKTIREARRLMPSDSTNPMAGLLMIDSHVDSRNMSGFGLVPEKWASSSLGDVLVIRKDGRPLDPAYLNAFCTWIRDEIQPSMKRAREEMMAEVLNSLRESQKESQTGYKEGKGKEAAAKVILIQEKFWDEITRAKFKAWCQRSRLDVM